MLRSLLPEVGDVEETGYENNARFAPFRGYREYVQRVKNNPFELLALPLVPFAAGRRGLYGEFGEGLLGGAMYALSLPGNVVMGLTTDAYNIATGNSNPTSNTPNVVQSLLLLPELHELMNRTG